MNYLIAGGAGFIGSNLIKSLENKAESITILDSCYSGNEANILNYFNSPHFEFLKFDVQDPRVVALEQNFDVIFNLACPASPVKYQSDPIYTLETCFTGTRNLLELARRNKAVMLHASTSEVYGDPLVHPQPESYRGNVNPIGIRACYDEGKRVAETLCFEYRRLYKVDARVIRIFNTYGPMMDKDDGRVVSNFINQGLSRVPVTVYGDGEQTRSFCHVSDMVRALQKVVDHDCGADTPINLGNPCEFTINELVEAVSELFDYPLEVQYRPLPQDDPVQRKPDIQLAKALLDWEPIVNLRSGLRDTFDYFAAQQTEAA